MMPVPAGAARRHDLAGAVTAAHVVMQRASLPQRNADQRALGGFGRLADGFRHFARLAVAEADPAFLVADDDQRGEAEAPAALHHFGDAIDVDELVDEFAVALFVVAARGVPAPCLRPPISRRHRSFGPSEIQSAFARPFGERLDAAVINIAAAVEHDVLDAFVLRPLGDQLADRLGRIDGRAGLQTLARVLLQRGGRDQGRALLVVDDLRVDLLDERNTESRLRACARAASCRGRGLAAARSCLSACSSAAPYFFLPSLRKMNSSAYLMPLPL